MGPSRAVSPDFLDIIGDGAVAFEVKDGNSQDKLRPLERASMSTSMCHAEASLRMDDKGDVLLRRYLKLNRSRKSKPALSRPRFPVRRSHSVWMFR